MKRLESFELHHKILAFIFILSATIFFVRVGVRIYNPNPVLFGFEIHHFDYGILLLIFSNLLLLFGKKRYGFHLLLSAVGLGLVLDQIWFIRENISNLGASSVSIYNATFPSVVVLTIFITLVIILLNHFNKNQ